MQCECGKEIHNVPEHLYDLAKWQCKECGRNVDTTGRRVKSFIDQIAEESYDVKRKAA